MRYFYFLFILIISCSEKPSHDTSIKRIPYDVVTEKTATDTDDPAIWYNKSEPSKSLVIGTDKDDVNGGLYVFDLSGKIVNQHLGMKRVNNVDIEYNFTFGEEAIDIAVVTERGKNKIRVFKLPELIEIDNGGIDVFVGEEKRSPMGVSLYNNGTEIYAILGRKSGPSDDYLWQYRLEANNNVVSGALVRKFGKFSGKKEIEAICVDDELGYIYYSDEQHGVRKYFADPKKGNDELAIFGKEGFQSDHEGISIYKSGPTTGYIIVSDQQSNTFHFFKREGEVNAPHTHKLIKELPLSTTESDGSEIIHHRLNSTFTKGLFVAMSDDKTFQFYDVKKFLGHLK